MGRIRHDAIVVTGPSEQTNLARAHAARHFADSEVHVTEVTPTAVNNTASFLVAPDGSKEGWAESDAGDRLRAAFVKWLRVEGPSMLDWIEVNFGGDESVEAYVRRPLDTEFTRVPEEPTP